jgi:2',3'-cyclic-nucleotide 2'-phosphodiesterase (5'-nucleotidase family)
MSNFDEGHGVFRVLNEIGYDAIIPGNHDYDFGPLGWLYDRVTPGQTSGDPREVIAGLAKTANFPMLSANTFLKSTLLSHGRPIALDDQCRPAIETLADDLDFTNARPPDFLKPYVILSKAGVRVALIGLDNRSTSSTTTKENVSDLCFRDEVSAYLDLRRRLEGKADVFVILMHNGDTDQNFEGSEITRKINAAIPGGVHLVAAGHTHYTHDASVDGVRVIQDGANGLAYGRVDLYYDRNTHQVRTELTRSAAGIRIDPVSCDSSQADFACSQIQFPVSSDASVDSILNEMTTKVAPLAKQKLAVALGIIRVNRIDESPLGNALTDALRSATQTQIAIMNTGGIRTALPAGEITYENLFEVLPFQNQAAVIQRLPWKIIKAALISAIQTCGQYGTLVESGLKIRFQRDCSAAQGILDPAAKLIHVETVDGETLFDSKLSFEIPVDQTLSLATLDFIAAGGSGYSMFAGTSVDSKPGIARELIVNQWLKSPPRLSPEIDHRFQNVSK